MEDKVNNQGPKHEIPLQRTLTFLEDKWIHLPPTARTISYFVILISFIYWVFLIPYFDGKLTIRYKDHDIEAKDAVVKIDHDGRVLRISPDAEGYFSFPSPTQIPFQDILVDIVFDSVKAQRATGYLSSNKAIGSKRVELIYDYKSGEVEFGSPNQFGSILLSFFLSRAYASDAEHKLVKDNIAPLIINTVSDLSNIAVSEVDLGSRVRSGLGFGNLELSIINGVIKEAYGVDLWYVNKFDPEIKDIIGAAQNAYYEDISTESWLGNRLVISHEKFQENINSIEKEDKAAFLFARQLRKTNQSIKALPELERLSRNYSNSYYIVHFNLALAYDDLDLVEKANQKYLETILIMDSEGVANLSVLNTYARFLYRQMECEKSLHLQEKIKAIEPDRKELKQHIEDSRRCIETGYLVPINR